MDGQYSVVLNTPMGTEEGILELKTTINSISGYIKARNHINEIYLVKKDGDNISFTGKIKVGIMSITFNAKCTILNGKLNGTASTKYGDFKVTGKKI